MITIESPPIGVATAKPGLHKPQHLSVRVRTPFSHGHLRGPAPTQAGPDGITGWEHGKDTLLRVVP